MATALRNIYQLKVSLVGAKPPIWRRFVVDSAIKLPQLHAILQVIMGWTDSHLHQFIAEGLFYTVPAPDFDQDDRFLDEAKFRLNQLLKQEKDTLIYEYDFGDGWEHKLVLEKILPFTKDADLPSCLKGKGACPPEDVGGIWGYYDFLDALRDENHPEHEAVLDWHDGEFDPESFDIEEVNALLTEYFK